MSPDRAAIAAGAALLGLGALTGAAVTSGGEPSRPAAATGPVEVRTQVIHDTAPTGDETEHGDYGGGVSRATRGGGQDD